jgi:hypothetical protein
MRKGEVFTFAAQLADADDRSRFAERAAFFCDASLSALIGSPTCALTRPIVLLLSNGFMRAACRPLQIRPAPASGATDYGTRQRFTPQKAIAKKRLRQSAVAAMLFVAIVLLGAVTSCGLR